jgi:hypothetical protein
MKNASHPAMNHRVNSVIHLVSACYWTLATALAFLLGPHPIAASILEFRVWVNTGVVLVGVDLFAGIRQWKSAVAGRTLSIVLHLVVAIFAVSLMTFEFLQAKPTSFIVWFKADDYWFLSSLGLVRLGVGTAMLFGNKNKC